jgi:glycosyltransferase involved in cell wall biosynthesis
VKLQEKIPKVSVCVVTYNQEKYIRQCLQSIVDQKTDFDFEVLVSDDCSADATQEIVTEFATRYPSMVKPIFHQKNIGASKNFISTHDAARGEYVCHMDGDDYWLPGKLSHQAEILDRNNAVVQCWTCANVVDIEGKKLKIFPSALARALYPSYLKTEDLVLSYALVGQHSTQMYRRLARNCNLIKGDVLDFYVAFIISLEGVSFYSKSILSAYRVGNISVTTNDNRNRVTVDLLAKHLFSIANEYPKYRKFAVANIFVRSIISRLAGHNVSIINELRKRLDSRVNIYISIRSFFYFMLQKI